MNRFFLHLAFVCTASLFCFGMCSKDDKTPPKPTIDKAKVLGTWSITKALFNYYDGNREIVRQSGIEKNGLHADLWDHSTLEVKDSTFTQTGIVAQDHLPHAGKWLLIDDGKKIRTIDSGNSQHVQDWAILLYSGSVLTIWHREKINNGTDEKSVEALLELTKE